MTGASSGNTPASRLATFAASAAELWRLLAATLLAAVRGAGPRGELLRQMFIIGNRSLVFVAVTLGFLGMVLTYQVCLQATRLDIADLSHIGPEFAKALIHEFAPTLTGMMLSARVAAGIAAEIGSMKVTEQIDALRMSGASPVEYLLAPRFVASIVMTVVLTVFAALVALGLAALTASRSFAINPHVFVDVSRVQWVHVGLGLGKSISYGMAIPVIAGFCGLRAAGSSEGVGGATTGAVIGSSLAVVILDFVISATGLVLFGEGL